MPTPRAPRKFGIEIECFNVNQQTRETVRRLGWIVKNDGSICGNDTAEIVSPPLTVSDAAFDSVRAVCAAIRDGGGKVNSTCGLHVHVEARDDLRVCKAGHFFTSLVTRYAMLEDQIDFLVPFSRRESRNNYCASTKNLLRLIQENRVAAYFRYMEPDPYARVPVSVTERNDNGNCTVRDYLEGNMCVGNLLYLFRGLNRYYKVNFNAYIQHGTVEFRGFGASLNSTKIIAWVKFCMNLMDRSRAMTLKTRQYRKSYTNEQLMDPFFGMTDRDAVRYLKQRIEENRANPNPIRNPRRALEQRRAARRAARVAPAVTTAPVTQGVTPVAPVAVEEVSPITEVFRRIDSRAAEEFPTLNVEERADRLRQIQETLRLLHNTHEQAISAIANPTMAETEVVTPVFTPTSESLFPPAPWQDVEDEGDDLDVSGPTW